MAKLAEVVTHVLVNDPTRVGDFHQRYAGSSEINDLTGLCFCLFSALYDTIQLMKKPNMEFNGRIR